MSADRALPLEEPQTLAIGWNMSFVDPAVERAYQAHISNIKTRTVWKIALMLTFGLCVRQWRIFTHNKTPFDGTSLDPVFISSVVVFVSGTVFISGGLAFYRSGLDSPNKLVGPLNTILGVFLVAGFGLVVVQTFHGPSPDSAQSPVFMFNIGCLILSWPLAAVTLLHIPTWAVGMTTISAFITVFTSPHIQSDSPFPIVAVMNFLLVLYETESTRRAQFKSMLEILSSKKKESMATEEKNFTKQSAYHAVSHCAKRVMLDCLHWCDTIESHIIPPLEASDCADVTTPVSELQQIAHELRADLHSGARKCHAFLVRSQLADGTHQAMQKPVRLRQKLKTWSRRANLDIEVHTEIPDFVLLAWDTLEILIDNALHNAAGHGEENGPISMAWSEVDGRLVASLENNPGPNHDDAMQLQTLHGANFLFCKESKARISEIGNAQSTFCGRDEMMKAAELLGGDLSLIFDEGKVVFSLSLELCKSSAPATCSGIKLPEGVCLLCADDDRAPRAGYAGLAKLLDLQPSSTIILGETHTEAQSITDHVLREAKERGDHKVACILDQNMDKYDQGAVYGTAVTQQLRRRGFQGAIFIRSANDDAKSFIKYKNAGADGCFSKRSKTKDLAVEFVAKCKAIWQFRFPDFADT